MHDGFFAARRELATKDSRLCDFMLLRARKIQKIFLAKFIVYRRKAVFVVLWVQDYYDKIIKFKILESPVLNTQYQSFNLSTNFDDQSRRRHQKSNFT